MQKLVTEKDKLQKQITNIEHESNVQREKLVIAHTEEKKMLLKVNLLKFISFFYCTVCFNCLDFT